MSSTFRAHLHTYIMSGHPSDAASTYVVLRAWDVWESELILVIDGWVALGELLGTSLTV